MPAGPAVGGFEKAAAGFVVLVAVFPRALADFPHRGVHHIRICGVELNVRAAGIFIFVERWLPRLPAIGGEKNSALFVWAIRMAKPRRENTIRIARVHNQRGNLLGVAQAEMSPRFPRIGGLVNSITHGKVGALKALAAGGVDNVRV